MSNIVRLSNRAARDLDRLDRNIQERVLNRLNQLAQAPYDPRFSNPLTDQGGLRKSRVGGWRVIFSIDNDRQILDVVTIERRGQVYQRL